MTISRKYLVLTRKYLVLTRKLSRSNEKWSRSYKKLSRSNEELSRSNEKRDKLFTLLPIAPATWVRFPVVLDGRKRRFTAVIYDLPTHMPYIKYGRWGHVNHLCNHRFWDQTQWKTCGSPVLGIQSKSHTLKHTLAHIDTVKPVLATTSTSI